MKRYFIGESCLCWSLGSGIDADISRQVLAAYKLLIRLRASGDLLAQDVVPCYNALAVYFDPVTADLDRLRKSVEAVLEGIALQPRPEIPGKTATFPVSYRGEDLDRVARHSGLPVDRVIALHAEASYTVATIGFLPHFPYLIGLPPPLATPRLDSPRLRVPAGSVAIGGAQTGIYPADSPGGWNIIGSTDSARLNSLEPGDTVRFTPI